ncbi:MAG: ABC transporter permease [Dehalococcoidia bacterium]|nr:ABC transporter permease [Dehalococcoidia bacterium]
MSVALAYFRRDFQIWSSYRLAALWQLVTPFMLIGLIYFAGEAIGDRSDLIKEENGSYVAFILVGVAFADVLLGGLNNLPQQIHDQQRLGMLEPTLVAPIRNLSLLTSIWLFRFSLSLVRMTMFMAFGFIALGFWHSVDPSSVILILIAAEITYLALGAFSAAFVILFKEGDPVRLAYAGFSTVIGGAIFPVDALPDWMEPIALLIPLTHALSGIREGLDGGSIADVAPQLITLTIMAVVLVPAALYAFSWALQRAKREGSLGQY